MVVFIKKEFVAIFSELLEPFSLFAQQIYDGGILFKDCLRLQVKDLDTEMGNLIVCSENGDQNLRTMLASFRKNKLWFHRKIGVQCI